VNKVLTALQRKAYKSEIALADSGTVSCASLVLGADENRTNSCSWFIDKTRIIGRASTDIQLQIIALSRRHAEVSIECAAYRIRDLGSRNGTAVNGRLLSTEPLVLNHGDSILLAGEVELFFRDPNATPFAPRLGSIRGLWIDPESQDVWVDAQRLIWPNASPEYINNDAIDSLIKRLRKRLSSVERGKPVLELVRGRGIRLKKRR